MDDDGRLCHGLFVRRSSQGPLAEPRGLSGARASEKIHSAETVGQTRASAFFISNMHRIDYAYESTTRKGNLPGRKGAGHDPQAHGLQVVFRWSVGWYVHVNQPIPQCDPVWVQCLAGFCSHPTWSHVFVSELQSFMRSFTDRDTSKTNSSRDRG